MDAEKETQSPQEPTEGEFTVKAATKSVIETAQELKDQIKAENDRREEMLKREELLEARRMLGGRSEAGQSYVKREPTDEEYAEDFMKGKVSPLGLK